MQQDSTGHKIIALSNIVAYSLLLVVYLIFYTMFTLGLALLLCAMVGAAAATLLYSTGTGVKIPSAVIVLLTGLAIVILLFGSSFVVKLFRIMFSSFYKSKQAPQKIITSANLITLANDVAQNCRIHRFSAIYLISNDLFTSVAFFRKKNLCIGPDILRLMPAEEIKALIAHEAGHHRLAQFGYDLLQFYFFNVYNQLNTFFSQAREYNNDTEGGLMKIVMGSWRAIIWCISKLHSSFLLLITFFQKRNQGSNYEFEFLCDKNAVKHYGANVMMAALDHFIAIKLFESLYPGKIGSIPNLQTLISKNTAHPEYTAQHQAMLDASTITHPSLAERRLRIALFNTVREYDTTELVGAVTSRNVEPAAESRVWKYAFTIIPLLVIISVFWLFKKEYDSTQSKRKAAENYAAEQRKKNETKNAYRTKRYIENEDQYQYFMQQQVALIGSLKQYVQQEAGDKRKQKGKSSPYYNEKTSTKLSILLNDSLIRQYQRFHHRQDTAYETLMRQCRSW